VPIHRDIRLEIEAATQFLVESGLADDQNLPFEAQRGPQTFVVHYSNAASFAPLLRDRPYSETYEEQRDERSYNVLMLDGALIQMVYEFENRGLRRCRLAFLPSPNLLEFQNNPELYMEERLYADVIDKRVVTVPLRFDYDGRPGVARPIDHPVSHLTLGQYSRCRIPTAAPITPYLFIEFILRSFYNSALENVSKQLPTQATRFAECIHSTERAVVHVGVPARP
jgi:hypothetical protein